MSQSLNELLAFCFEPRHLSGAFSTVILACTYWALRKAPIILVWPAIQYINIRNDYWKHIWSILLFLFSKVYEDDMFFDQHEIRWIMQINIRTISLPIPIIGYIDVLEHGHQCSCVHAVAASSLSYWVWTWSPFYATVYLAQRFPCSFQMLRNHLTGISWLIRDQ